MVLYPRNLVLVILLAGLGLAGCGEFGGEDLPRGSTIVNGALEGGHPEVGVLYSGGFMACTATLIGRHSVLSAAHCVRRTPESPELLEPSIFFLGGLGGTPYTATRVLVHPAYAGGNKADLALVQLTAELEAVQPAAITSTPPQTGEKVTMLGFGKAFEEESNAFGTKRSAANVVKTISSEFYSFFGANGDKGNLCDGDSGGPTFARREGEMVLIGVHSTKGGVCGLEGHDMRVDAFAQWIAEQADGDVTIKAANVPPDSPTNPGAPIKPQALGLSCRLSADCESKLCISTAEGGICSTGCIDDTGCPGSMRCLNAVCQQRATAEAVEQPGEEESTPETTGGCTAAGPTTTFPAASLLLLLGLLPLGRRGRRRGPR